MVETLQRKHSCKVHKPFQLKFSVDYRQFLTIFGKVKLWFPTMRVDAAPVPLIFAAATSILTFFLYPLVIIVRMLQYNSVFSYFFWSSCRENRASTRVFFCLFAFLFLVRSYPYSTP